MKFLLPLLLVGLTIPSRADMVFPDVLESPRGFQLQEQFITAEAFGGLYASGNSIPIFQVANNPGLGLGLFNRNTEGRWVPALFPRGIGARQNNGLFEDPDTESELSGAAITTPEPATIVALGAAVGTLLLFRRRKR